MIREYRSRKLLVLSFACAAAVVLTASCAAVQFKLSNRFASCLTDREADTILPVYKDWALKTKQRLGAIETAGEETVIVEKSCRRRVYRFGNNSVEIVKSEGNFGSTKMYSVDSTPVSGRSAEETEKCLTQAAQDLRGFRFADGEAIVDAYRDRYPQRWNDQYRTFALWLDCSHGRDSNYYDSLDTFVHEMTHGLQKGDCRTALPGPSAVVISKFPIKDPDQLHGLTAIQNTYQYAWENSRDFFPLLIFDELNAYTIGTETMTAELRSLGAPAVEDKDKSRPLVNLPLFAFYAVKYLTVVKEQNPQLYQENFAEGTSNRKVVDMLLARADNAYADWVAEIKRAKLPEYAAETNVWQQYLALKPAIAS
jgi:hypothetical protein